jgi:hypothetical protein
MRQATNEAERIVSLSLPTIWLERIGRSLAFVERIDKGELGIKALHREFEPLGERCGKQDEAVVSMGY